MTPDGAKRLVVFATAGTVGITVAAQAVTKQTFPSSRVPVGAMFAGVMLAGLAEVQPQIAGGLAAVMLLTTVLTTGAPFWQAIAKYQGTTH